MSPQVRFHAILHYVMPCFLVACTQLAIAQPAFERVTEQQNLTKTFSNLPSFGGGISFVDFDRDGWDDITMTTDSLGPLIFFKNYYGHYEEVSMGISNYTDARSVFWFDYDHDDDLDLLVILRDEGIKLYRNENSQLSDVTLSAGLNGLGGVDREGCGIGDFNNDGLLDLYICSYESENTMFFQKPNHTFENVTTLSQTSDSIRASFQAIVLDANQDGYQDFYVSNDFLDGNTFYLNQGDSTFEEISALNGTDQYLCSMGQCLGDFDNDSDLDIFITDRFYQSRLLRNDSNAGYTEIGQSAGVDYAAGFGWGCIFFDADFDGDQDLYVSGIMLSIFGGEPSLMFINEGNGTFSQDTLPADSLYSFSNALGDFNNDMMQDIVVLNSNGNYISLWQNIHSTPAAMLSVELEGCTSNRFGAGAEVRAYDNGTTTAYAFNVMESFLGQHSQRKLIPVFDSSGLDSLKVRWPNGGLTTLYDVHPDQRLVISECDSARPDPVILVPDYGTQQLTLCGNDSILLVAAGTYPQLEWTTEDTLDSIYVYTPGLVGLSATNQFGQSDSATEVQVHFQEAPPVDVNVETSLCHDGNAITLIPTDSTIVHSFSWSNGSNSSRIEGLEAGTYTVTITYDGHCPKEETFVIVPIDSLDPIELAISTSDPHCHGGQNGLIHVHATGGTGPLEVLWSDSATDTIRSLGSGTYSLTVSDSVGCFVDTSIHLGQPDAYEISVQSIPDTNHQGIGSAKVNVSGATPPYDFLWSDPFAQSLSEATQLDSGAYDVWIQDAMDCDTTVQALVGNVNANGFESPSPYRGITCVSDGRSLTAMVSGTSADRNELSLNDLQGRHIEFEWQWKAPGVVEVQAPSPGQYVLHWQGLGACRWVKLAER